jgi:spore germination protein
MNVTGKPTLKFVLFLLFLMIAVPTVIYGQDEGDAEVSETWCVSVWYPSSDYPTGYESIIQNTDVIDVVNPFWYTPQPDGTLQAHSDAEDAEKLVAWREAGLKIIPSIFSNISMMIEEPEIRAFHVQQIVDLVERMDYDGIDIDYESFALSTRDAFSTFIEELGEALHANNRLLSIAVHAKTSDEGSWEGAAAQDWVRIAAAVDIFGVMTYDYTSRNDEPGPIAPPEWVLDVLAYTESIIDLSRVRMGVPFYGYSWLRGSPPATTISWESAQRSITSFDLPITRDPVDMEARVDLNVRGLPPQTIYLADSVGLEYRMSLIMEAYPQLGGIAIWGIGGEDPASWDVLRALEGRPCA